MKKGFTLIEILIVVAIIALLATIVLVGVGSFRSKGRDARRISDLNNVRNVLELYFSKEGKYPDVATWADLEVEIKAADIGVSYLPHDPTTGWDYGYCVIPPAVVGGISDTSRYAIAAHLEDGSNPALLQNPSYPCQPTLPVGTPDDGVACSIKPAVGVAAAPTTKLCLTIQ